MVQITPWENKKKLYETDICDIESESKNDLWNE